MTDNTAPPSGATAFFDLALDLFCIAGLDGYFKKVNPSFGRTLGYTSEELLSRPFLDFVHPDDRERAQTELARLAGGRDAVHIEIRFQRKDGTWRWLAWTCPTPEDDSGLLYAVGRDVTAQKEAEEELRIRDSIFSSMQNGLLITDARQPDNPIVYCNQAFCDLTGYAAEDVLGRNCRFLQGDDRTQPQLDVLRDAIHKAQPCRVLVRNYRKDGSMFWNELIISPVRDSNDALTHFVGLQYDISEMMRANSSLWEEVSGRLELLAPRQREIVDFIVAGMNTKSIASQMGISPKTVENHRARAFAKMSVSSTIELVRMVLGSQK